MSRSPAADHCFRMYLRLLDRMDAKKTFYVLQSRLGARIEILTEPEQREYYRQVNLHRRGQAAIRQAREGI